MYKIKTTRWNTYNLYLKKHWYSRWKLIFRGASPKDAYEYATNHSMKTLFQIRLDNSYLV